MKYCPYCGAALLGGAASFSPAEAGTDEPPRFCVMCGKHISAPEAQPGRGPTPHEAAPDAQPERRSSSGEAAPTGYDLPRRPKRPAPYARAVSGETPPRPEHPEMRRAEAHRRSADTEIKPERRTSGYDGYYRDVRPVDDGHEAERMDPELLKRVCLIAGGAVLIITIAILLMQLL